MWRNPVSFPKYKSAFFIIGKISFILKLDSEKQFILIFEFKKIFSSSKSFSPHAR